MTLFIRKIYFEKWSSKYKNLNLNFISTKTKLLRVTIILMYEYSEDLFYLYTYISEFIII